MTRYNGDRGEHDVVAPFITPADSRGNIAHPTCQSRVIDRGSWQAGITAQSVHSSTVADDRFRFPSNCRYTSDPRPK